MNNDNTTSSHSEETETTPQRFDPEIIYSGGHATSAGMTLDETGNWIRYAEYCELLDYYSQLKAENERLEKEVLKLESENEKQLSELLKTGETLDACENVLADAQIDNEAKDKRIQELEKLADRMRAGRDYLMQVNEDEVTVTDALVAFGYGRDGLQNRV